jgi:hypothetical protein
VQDAVRVEIDVADRGLLDEQHAEREEHAEHHAHRRPGLDAPEALHQLDEHDRRHARDRRPENIASGAPGRAMQERDHQPGEHAVADRVAHQAQPTQHQEVAQHPHPTAASVPASSGNRSKPDVEMERGATAFMRGDERADPRTVTPRL